MSQQPLMNALYQIGTPARIADHVDIWQLDLADLDLPERDITSVLSIAERTQAQRFARVDQARLWSAVRASLRLLLANRLVCTAADITFEIGPNGKPSCQQASFNVSHSRSIALIALARTAPAIVEIGVDVEAVSDRRDVLELADIVCTEAERSALTELETVARQTAFTRLWTRKEAWLKAKGVGLGFGAKRVHVGVEPTSSLVPVRVDDAEDKTVLLDLPAPNGYFSCVCLDTAQSGTAGEVNTGV